MDSKVADHSVTTVATSVTDRTTTDSQTTTVAHRTTIAAHRMAIVVLTTVLVLHNNRTKEEIQTDETKADSLSKQKEHKNET